MSIVPNITRPVNTVAAGKHYQVLSSDGKRWYNVLVQADASLKCDCLAGGYGKHCKHVDSAAYVLAIDNWQAFADRVNARAVAAGVVPAERIAAEREAAQRNRNPLAASNPRCAAADKELLNSLA